MLRHVALFAAGLTLVVLVGCQNLGALLPAGGGQSGALTAETVAAGLKEALNVGTQAAVARRSAVGGFANDPQSRLALPPNFQKPAAMLRQVGMGAMVDTVEARMNAAAEQAAGKAAPVFVDAIKQMTINDAMGLLKGGETSATDYFRGKTQDQLAAAFKPVVAAELTKVGALRSYSDMVAKYQALPLAPKVNLSLEDYVTTQALTGLFAAVASEEKRIRADPAARTTALLRRVFAQ